MMRGEDLAGLLAPNRQEDPLGFHSGTVLAWDTNTGANSVQVAGAVLADVPILNTSEAIKLEAGDVVGLLRFRSTYFILGRVTVPGTDAFGSSSVDFDAQGDTATGFALSTSPASKVSRSFTVPEWARRALVYTSGWGAAN